MYTTFSMSDATPWAAITRYILVALVLTLHKLHSSEKHSCPSIYFYGPIVFREAVFLLIAVTYRNQQPITLGVTHPDCSIGVYAPDAEAYEMFKELFNPIIFE